MRDKAGWILAILLAIAGLSAVDLFLAKTESQEVRGAASRDCQSGDRLLAEGKAEEATGILRKAHAMNRDDSACALKLVSALMQMGKSDDAQTLLTDELDKSPNDGQANLLEARLMVLQAKYAEAPPYYHRAIYGVWKHNATRPRIEVRLELASFLAVHGSAEELLAELLPLEAESGNDQTIRKKLASLYLAANSPARAEGIYRGLISDNPRDPENYAGLGQAELALGNYRPAHTAFDRAGSRDRAALAASLEEMDPTPRRLSATGKFSRSVAILELARAAAFRCSPELTKDADGLPHKRLSGEAANDLAEESLSMAEDLWHERYDKCGESTASDEQVLRLLMTKLSHR